MSNVVSLRQPSLLKVPEKKRRVVYGGGERIALESTGEVLEVATTTLVAGDAEFTKFWVANILATIDQIGNSKIRVLFYILSRIDPMTNMFTEPVVAIARGAGVSERTVVRTLKVLGQYDVIRRLRPRVSILQLNPNLMMTGSSGKRRALLIRFEQLELPLAADTVAEIPALVR